MPQQQLPIFPAGAKRITDEIAAQCCDKQVVYLYAARLYFSTPKTICKASGRSPVI